MFPSHNKGIQQLVVLHTSQHFLLKNITKEPSQVLQLNANGISNKMDEIRLLIKNTKADAIKIQKTKLN